MTYGGERREDTDNTEQELKAVREFDYHCSTCLICEEGAQLALIVQHIGPVNSLARCLQVH